MTAVADSSPSLDTHELNNNNREEASRVDIVSLLQLKEPVVEPEDQLSHASSLESLLPRQGSHSPAPSDCSDSLSGSTSCSESSFEMASTSSFSEEELRHASIPPSHSLDSFQPSTSSSSRPPTSFPVRQSIEREVSELDTRLPQLDLVGLDDKIAQAKLQQDDQRKRLGEEVRRRLALQVDSYDAFPSSSSACSRKTTLKSNMGQRLQAASMQLQVCYMNELSEEESELDDEDDDDDGPMCSAMRTSKSVPDFKEAAARARKLRRHAYDGVRLTPGEREDVLRSETLAVQAAATNEGKRTVQELRDARRKAQERSARQRYSRQLLSKMSTAQLREIHETIEDLFDATNAQLVSLLMARDSLHMERDSLLVDIGDVVEGHRSSQIDIPTLLRLQDTNPQVPHDLSTPT